MSSVDFKKKKQSRIPSVSYSLDPEQVRHFVEPDLGPHCLQGLSGDNTSKQIAKVGVVWKGEFGYL